MKHERRQLIFYGASASVSLIFAVLSIVCSVGREQTALKVLFAICAVLLFVLAALMAVLMLLSVSRERNFFLYDPDTGKNISPDELTVQAVNARLDELIEEQFDGAERLIGRGGLVDGDFGLYGVLRPAVAYRLLFRAAEDAALIDALQTCDEKTLRTLCQSLKKAGETNMSDAILRHREAGGDAERLARFLGGNRRYLQGRLMSYIKRNMELFY